MVLPSVVGLIVVSVTQARALALSLDGAEEMPHHGFPSFRVRGRIFATLPNDAELRIMCDEPGILTAVDQHPDSCREFYWGKKLSCVVVTLSATDSGLVEELLTDAWELRRG